MMIKIKNKFKLCATFEPSMALLKRLDNFTKN